MSTVEKGHTVSRWSLLLAVFTVILGVGTAWQLITPAAPDFSTPVRALADCVGAVVFGLCAAQRVHTSGARLDRRQLWRAVASLAGVWALAELVLVAFAASDAGGYRVNHVGAGTFADFAAHISTGRIGMAAAVCAAAIAVVGTVAYRRGADWSTDPLLALAGLTVILRPITGHMSQQGFGSALVAAHVLAAALWFGLLVALAILLRTRSDWATALPRYSTWALRCVVVVTVTGVINAAVRLDRVAAVVDTGYGRVALAKTVMLLITVVMSCWWRRTWVDRAAGHRVDAADSLRRAVIEVVVIAAAFGLAAALATTA